MNELVKGSQHKLGSLNVKEENVLFIFVSNDDKKPKWISFNYTLFINLCI